MNTDQQHIYESQHTAQGSATKASFDGLTSIRGLAAWWVVLYHFRVYCEPYLASPIMRFLDHGYMAVDIFFVLSGFVIYLNYADQFRHLSPQKTLTFLVKRLARIYPLHIFMLVAYLSIPVAVIIFRPGTQLPPQYGARDFIYNALLIHNWGLTSQLTWNFPSWSISTEWAAYLLFPIMALGLGKLRNRSVYLVLIGAVAVSLLALLYHLRGETSIGQTIAGLGTLRCILEFMSGAAMCAYFQRSLKNGVFKRAFALTLSAILVVAFSFGLAADYVLLPAAIVLSLFALAGFEHRKLSILKSRMLVFLGEISYSTYMIHIFVLQWFKLLFVEEPGVLPAIWIPVYPGVVLVGSLTLYRYVEKPAQRYINKQYGLIFSGAPNQPSRN